VSKVYVFGYGSLVALPGAVPARLRGYRRTWGVAMDNTVATPGYKVYENPEGERPPVAVAFLDLAEDPDTTIDGVLIEAPDLAALDARERQYTRIEVTAAVAPAAGPEGIGSTPPPLGPESEVWTYVGRAEGRARVATGRDGSAAVVIQRAYAEQVERAFAQLGPEALERYRATTEPPPFALAELARVDL
jgi:cation transport regulator ChaC